MPYITPAAVPAEKSLRLLAIPDESYFLAAASGAIFELCEPETWEQVNGITAEDAAAAMLEMYFAYRESSLIGVIMPYVTTNAPGGTLACDGSRHARADYPTLYAAIDSTYHDGPDHFYVPDLRDRFLLGSGARAVGSSGGEETHLLTIQEMPAHQHSEVPAVTTLINGGLEAPATASAPGIGSTGMTGGGLPHNNMPPYSVVKYCIVAV